MVIRQCDEVEYERHFNLRNFNPPDYEAISKEQFEDEFGTAVSAVEGVLEKHSKSWGEDPDAGDFTVYGGHNDTRFIDVSFEHSGFLDETLLSELQKESGAHGPGWMICLWFTNWVFVTPSEVIVYPQDPEELPEWLSVRLAIGM